MSHTPRLYVYAVTAAEPAPPIAGLVGVAAGGAAPEAVEALAVGPVSAIVSAFSAERVRPERRNLAAHQGVLRALMAANLPVLPVAFGALAPSRRELTHLLEVNAEPLASDLERVAGRVEMGLKVAWDVSNIFEYFVFRYPELAELRDRLQKRRGGPTRDERIELGQAFETTLGDARGRHLSTVKRALKACVHEFRADPAREEKQVMNLSCLVDRDRTQDFEAAVLSAASLFDDNFAFDFSGPWPPYHFVSVRLADAAPAEISARG